MMIFSSSSRYRKYYDKMPIGLFELA
jgi:hypothetical protein